MKTRYRLIRRGIRGNKFYCVDTSTGKRTSLGTANEDDAKQVVAAKNNSERQPVLNLQIAKAYLAGSDTGMTTRTWQNAIESLIGTKQGANQHRWKTAAKDKALAMLATVTACSCASTIRASLPTSAAMETDLGGEKVKS
jgi:hypothetical protein